jgi:hypothetical protein
MTAHPTGNTYTFTVYGDTFDEIADRAKADAANFWRAPFKILSIECSDGHRGQPSGYVTTQRLQDVAS